MTTLIDPATYRRARFELHVRRLREQIASLDAAVWEDAFQFDCSLPAPVMARFIGLSLVTSFEPSNPLSLLSEGGVRGEASLLRDKSTGDFARPGGGARAGVPLVARLVPAFWRAVLRKAPSERASVPHRHQRGDR